MSLINEALKKAQRQRSDEPAGISSPGERGDYRAQPKTTQMIVLIAAGAAVLVVFSVVITVYLLNRTTISSIPPIAAATTPKVSTVDVSAPSPVIVPPVFTPPPSVPEKPATESSVSTVAAVVPATTISPNTAAAAPIAIPPIAPAERQPDLQIQLFVDSIRVMGIRSQGGESKVMMNDRVYRVNDIVDRTHVLRLVKVEPELLTFTDPNGMVYTKSF